MHKGAKLRLHERSCRWYFLIPQCSAVTPVEVFLCGIISTELGEAGEQELLTVGPSTAVWVLGACPACPRGRVGASLPPPCQHCPACPHHLHSLRPHQLLWQQSNYFCTNSYVPSAGHLIPAAEMQLNTATEGSNSLWTLFGGQCCFCPFKLFYPLSHVGSVLLDHLHEILGFQPKTHPGLRGFVFLCGRVDTDANLKALINADQLSYPICLARRTDNHLGYARKSNMNLTANLLVLSVIDTNCKAFQCRGMNLFGPIIKMGTDFLVGPVAKRQGLPVSN